jgi:hypothetical protein|tara:strand:+ start:4722 stop:4898 length:177 start_codon:yes stop_codon:yes gene_type:complete
MDNKTYTAREVAYNINTLTNRIELLKLDRTEISQEINQIKKQVTAWEDLDESQFKMFK